MTDRFTLSLVVQKQLKAKNLIADEILRRALNIKAEGFTTPDGKHLPEGTILIAWFKGKALAALIKNGGIEVEGKIYSSLSAAAAHYTGRPTTNGWNFWYAKAPGKEEFVPVIKAVEELRAA